ncbi:camphor resistance protein CrcB [Jatrophihabitans endophyticus]|uniref:Fluoride-specific ion channel FluC n=1 Tax=Jatrophihabitans endophyticus TaxID=1206085 RepID=A0A1M5H3M6_9ACTN|nr:fluoride efflux transporter CrcB [Jatrophihabitans endophyticus]SHG10342.1 camphor resistance protein CrcB [Jatrophihabitans endophyticus]
MTTVLVVLAGGVGAVARFVVDGVIRSRWPSRFPWATIVINVSGSLLLGVLTGLMLYRQVDTDVRLVLGTGFCGGYTTFSTATFETVRLLQQGRRGHAVLNGLGTALLCLGAAALGLVATQ